MNRSVFFPCNDLKIVYVMVIVIALDMMNIKFGLQIRLAADHNKAVRVEQMIKLFNQESVILHAWCITGALHLTTVTAGTVSRAFNLLCEPIPVNPVWRI